MNLMAKTKNILEFNKLKEISKFTSLIKSDGPYLVQRSTSSTQLLKASDDFEKILFKKSKRYLVFREHVIIRVHTKQGLSLDSKILKGSFNSFKNIALIEEEMRNLEFLVRKKSFDVKSYEIIHTHPTGCYLENVDGHQVITLGGLSLADYKVADYLEEKYEITIDLRAICPGNVTYCSV
ncbi:hypothetical protein A9Q84_17700 [Halobacteriovorax marinus]|uniref:Uncharacterized protein n=1 Tax=Halobacteriovorax marinus TaxID=97084 RepID=A0A1Y5F392_9BACT|nr:hypothetical protein A9Q84_17700 [Halobacteriovorax marinus]